MYSTEILFEVSTSNISSCGGTTGDHYRDHGCRAEEPFDLFNDTLLVFNSGLSNFISICEGILA